MAEFVLKSTISLAILSALYFVFLRNIKAFAFNRFFLLFALFFSVSIPFLQININFGLPVNLAIQESASVIAGEQIQDPLVVEQQETMFNIQNLLLFIYLMVSAILLFRFIVNIYRITKTIRKSEKVSYENSRIVLIQEKNLPYSFLNYIIVNKTDFKSNNIDNGLIIHEQTHCKQKHSVDIIIIEIAKVLLWFNPFIWILKKEMQLVHEYIADNKVLQNKPIETYQNVLLNLVFRNNSTYLASNFNYSLTKKRLIMMKKDNSSVKTIARKIAVVPFVLVLAITLSFSQNTLTDDNKMSFSNEWWYPILEKHDIELSAFNNFENVFFSGSSITMNDGVVKIEDALFIIKQGDDKYRILETSEAIHDMSKNIIKGDKGFIRTFSMDMQNMNEVDKNIKCTSFEIQVDDKNKNWIVDMNTGHVSTD